MIPAKITNLDPVRVTYPPIPQWKDYTDREECAIEIDKWFDKWYNKELIIADVENVTKSYQVNPISGSPIDNKDWFILYRNRLKKLSLNQSCFIEPTGEGKCKIIRL